MKKVFKWYNNLSNRIRNSANITLNLVGGLSAALSVLGVSLADWKQSTILTRLFVLLVLCVACYAVTYYIIGKLFKNSVSLSIQNTRVTIESGNIFSEPGWRVIGCDTHFDTRVDDIVISKKSLHGQLVLEHGDANEIAALVEKEARSRNIQANDDGLYSFPLGTILRYKSTRDNNTYLLLAMTKLDDNFEAHTDMAAYEHMLMAMWKEIDRVYASHPIILPLLGAGISRFDNGPKDKKALLKCMLCTLNSSAVSLNSKVKILLFEDADDIPLYEYKDMFRSISKV